MIVTMTRLRVVGLKRDLDPTLAALQEAGCIQLLDAKDIHPGLAAYVLAAEQRELETLGYLLVRLDALLALLPPQIGLAPEPVRETDLAVMLQADLDANAPELETLAQQRHALSNDADVLPNHATTLRKLSRLTPSMTDLADYETVALLINRRYAGALDVLQSEMRNVAGERCTLVSDQVDSDTVGALLVYPRAFSVAMQGLLGRVQVNQVSLPDTLRNVPFADALAHIERRLQQIPGEIAAVDARLAEAGRQHQARWLAYRQAVQSRLEQLRVRARLGETGHTFVLVGWIPERDVAAVRQLLEQRLPQYLVIDELAPTAEEAHAAPVLLESVAVVRPFQFFLRLLSLPRYGTIDPTVLMALFMPLFFGLMLGDIGYSLFMLVVGLVAYRRFAAGSGMRDLVYFIILGSIWGVVWGFVFGEFFGSVGHDVFGLQPLWKERSSPDALPALLIFSIAMGVMHVCLGLLLGVWQAWCLHHASELWERVGMLVGLVGLFLLVGVVAKRLPAGWATPGVVVVIVGLALLIRGLGPIGALMAPVELLSTVGNILSYLRLAAIGLASVYLAMVGNMLAVRAGSMLVGVLIAVLFHALNIALGAFSPTIHALRLHYVEFFTKFYESGGEPFQPLGGRKWI